MKRLKYLLIVLVIAVGFTSCQSVRVSTDYDDEVDFNQYQTFAFYKPGIDEAEISDLDKRRILKAIDYSLTEKGMTKDKNPDLLVSIFTDATEELSVYPRHYGGWYSPWYGPYNNASVQSRTEGTLYIDLIDAKTKNLVWQGVGTGALEPHAEVNKKTEKINKIVQEILNRFPPGAENKK